MRKSDSVQLAGSTALREMYSPLSLAELRKHSDEAVVKTIQTKLQNYNTLKTEHQRLEITAIRKI